MAFTSPRTWISSEIVTAALMNTHVRDNERYLNGLDGDVTINDDLILAEAKSLTFGDELLATTDRKSVV